MEFKISCPKCDQHLLIDNPVHLSNVECPICGCEIFFYKLEDNRKPYIGYKNGVFHMPISKLLSAITTVIVSEYKYTVVSSNENMVSFETGMTMWSNSGMTGTIVIQKINDNEYTLIGSGKQNIRGAQVFSFFGGTASACNKTNDVINSVKTYVRNKYKSF